MTDILFKTDSYSFSYRVAGILIQNGRVLLQKPTNDPGYAFPGGHVAFGETHAETLVREFKEEIGIDIEVGELKWVGELFFPWDDKPCQQICLFYAVKLKDAAQLPSKGHFIGSEHLAGRTFTIEFHWIPLAALDKIEVYPTNVVELLAHNSSGVQHFIYKENGGLKEPIIHK